MQQKWQKLLSQHSVIGFILDIENLKGMKEYSLKEISFNKSFDSIEDVYIFSLKIDLKGNYIFLTTSSLNCLT